MCLMGERLEMIWFLVPWLNICPHGGLKVGQIWVFGTSTEKLFIQFISNIASVLIWWVFRLFSRARMRSPIIETIAGNFPT